MLKQKIAETHLFAEYEKVDILAHLDEFSDSDKKLLEQVLDEYDKKYKDINVSFRSKMAAEIDTIAKNASTDTRIVEAIARIKKGITSLTTG